MTHRDVIKTAVAAPINSIINKGSPKQQLKTSQENNQINNQMKFYQQQLQHQLSYQLQEAKPLIPSTGGSLKVSPTNQKKNGPPHTGIHLSEKLVLVKPQNIGAPGSTTAQNGIMFKQQFFSGKNYPVAKHASVINTMLTSQKKLKVTNLQNSITSSMLVRQSEQQPKIKVITQRVKGNSIHQESSIIKPSSISFVEQAVLGAGGIHRYKKSEGDSIKKAIVTVRSKATFQTESKEQPNNRGDSTGKKNAGIKIISSGDDSYFRIQTRQPSASKLPRGSIIVKATPSSGTVVSSLERNQVKYQTTRKPGVSVLRDRHHCVKTTTEYSSCGKSSIEEANTDELNQQSILMQDKTFTKSVLGGCSSSMNCGSEEISPQMTKLPTASKIICNQLNALNNEKCPKPLKLEQVLANIENIPPQLNIQENKVASIKNQVITNQNSVKYFKSSWRRKNNLNQERLPQENKRSNKIPLKLMPDEQLRYLNSYESRLLRSFQDYDRLNQKNKFFQRGYSHHEEISEPLRARLVDWVLHCTQVCEMEDRNIFFLVIRIIDFFYCMQSCSQPKSELQLTAISAIFMASKLLQINHIGLNFCFSNIGHNKYSYTQMNERESQIMELFGWEISNQPTIYEVFELLYMMLQKRLSGRIYEKQSEVFMNQSWNLGIMLIKAHLCSFDSIMRKKNVEVASSALQISIAYFCLQSNNHPLSSSQSHSFLADSTSPQDPPLFRSNSHPPEISQDPGNYYNEIFIIVSCWRNLCKDYSLGDLSIHMISLLSDILRLREMMSLQQLPQQEEGTTGGQQLPTRIKEIMLFTDDFVDWAYVQLEEGKSYKTKIQGPVMMFQTDEEVVTDEELEDQVHCLR